jgi:hypothetical protein
MNTQLTPPPDHDLRPAVRARQRDELVAIVDHESATSTPRRRLVPLLAAAAVIAVTAGIAVGVPLLRDDQAPIAGTNSAVTEPVVQPLPVAEQVKYMNLCKKDGQPGEPKLIDSFQWTNPSSDIRTVSWVVVRRGAVLQACGFDAEGQRSEMGLAASGTIQEAAIQVPVKQGDGVGAGTYTKIVARVTVASGTEPASDAILRQGFIFSPKKWVDVRSQTNLDSPLVYTVRGYDAAGKLIFESPKTHRDLEAFYAACYTDPAGKKVVIPSANPSTDTPGKCKRGVAWTWPR